MKKKAISFFIVLTLLFSLCVPAYAATYSDLDGQWAWAKTYMETLAGKGYLSGYDDGTMRPGNNITVAETLALLSRFYPLTELQSSYILDDYNDILNQNVPSSLSWAKDEISVCLAAGIVTQSELKSLDLNKAIEKERLALFLVRAMKMEKTASSLSSAKLSFADASDLSDSCKTHVALLFSLGIVTGDEKNNFNPKQSVTRAVVAAMVSRSLDYMEKNSVTLTIDAYAGLSRQEGIIASVSGRALSFYGYDGLLRVINIPLEASVTVNGAEKLLSSEYAGEMAVITSSSGTITKVEIASAFSSSWIQGTVTGTAVTTEVNSIYLTGRDGAETNYTVSSNAAITQSGEAVALSSLKKGYFATMKMENNVITKIAAVNGDTSVKGTITQISFGTTVTIKVTDSSSTLYSFSFSITGVPTITRGSKTITVDRLQTGDEITVAISDLAVTGITLSDNGVSVSGELTSIVNTVAGTSWTLKKSDGGSSTYTLGEGVKAYSGATEINVSNIKVGDSVTVTVYGSTIDEVKLVGTSVSSANQLTGSILLVNTAESTITLLTSSGKLVYISTSGLSWIIYADTGSKISLSALPSGSQVVVYGSYTSSTNFSGKIMIILA